MRQDAAALSHAPVMLVWRLEYRPWQFVVVIFTSAVCRLEDEAGAGKGHAAEG
jgi:hypothetical protein